MKKQFVVIGERCEDVFIYGHAMRLSPEAPVPIFTPVDTVRSYGMAQNVYRNLKDISINECSDIKVYDFSSLQYAIKTRYVDQKTNHYFLRVDECDHCYERFSVDDDMIDALQNADMVVISDYNKGHLAVEDYKIISDYAASALIVVDTKKVLSESIMKYVDFVKLNLSEYEKNYEALGYEFFERYEDMFIITKGGDGAEYKDQFFPTEYVSTIDVSGAGDTFLAAFAYMYSMTEDMDKAIPFANKMANIVVKKKGVSSIL